ncbi:hypothetical protein [Kibdelosporangium phytohabitans]|uniref:Uncharacterized protein n=1 Tax=Kibdelosporangium phytohabitans TaxID=860235 RepID=A0A0N9IB91_9PSEU|nr:hypothetical protein [Kibdelosporangium phytohabitans]ALG11929.1 hypothetical protein AOZ06_38205 [Kibdelosporangium phytohabitans]MBE1463383.1 hypothetical protein [Kibdelosporangium phytohabitans]
MLIAVLGTACGGGSTGGTAIPAGSSSADTGGAEERPGGKSPKAAVQALIDGVKENDKDKIDAAVCDRWPGPVSRNGDFALDQELDPPAQKAFPKGVPGDAREEGDKWTVPVDMPGDSPITVTVVQEGKGYFACGFGVAGG